MAGTLTDNQIQTIYRDESYEAFLSTYPTAAKELEDNGFFGLFKEKKISGASRIRTNLYGSYNPISARNPGEPLTPGDMAQGYNYWTAIRAEFTNIMSIPVEMLTSAIKLGDYAQTIGASQAINFAQSRADYFTSLLAFGGVASSVLEDYAGTKQRPTIYNHKVKGGAAGMVIAEIPNQWVAGSDNKPWFCYKGNEHVRANGDTIASFAGKSLGYFNAGNRNGGNMPLTENNVREALLHMENNVPFTADRILRQASMINTLVCSGNLRVAAAEAFQINEYRPGTPNNDKNPIWKGSGVFNLDRLIVNRLLPDNCWYLCAAGEGVNSIVTDYPILGDVPKGPIDNTYVDVFQNRDNKTWIRQFFAFWSHEFNEEADICWFAGSTPTAVSSGRPTAPSASDSNYGDW